MRNPKVSLIVPIYNVEKYLEQCLYSILNQTYKNIEIICINDGSTDKSLNIAEKFCLNDDRIVLVSQNNQGLSATRNKGIEIATGEFIMFVDSDDWIDFNTCELAVRNIEEYNADVVLWPYIREYENKSSNKVVFEEPVLFFSGFDTKMSFYRRMVGPINEELRNPENIDSLVTACMKLYRRDIIVNNEIKFLDTNEIGTEDALFNVYYFNYVNNSLYLNEFLYHYRRDNIQSLTTTYKPNLFVQWNKLFDLIENHVTRNELDETFLDALNNRIAFSIIGLGLNEIKNDKKAIETIKQIKRIISSARYKVAFRSLKLNFLPIHWKVFFTLAKLNNAIGLYFLLIIIKKVK